MKRESGGAMGWRGRSTLLAAVLATELGAVQLSYYTDGEIVSLLYGLLLVPNLLIAPLALWKPSWGVPLLMAPWLMIVPLNCFQGIQLARARREAGRIVAYADATWRETGRPPADLSGYRFRDPTIRNGIFFYQAGENGFSVDYGPPGNEDVAHRYDSAEGWGYYPD
jgi:hypothetical protein